MKRLPDKDLKMLEHLFSLSEKDLLIAMTRFLKKKYEQVELTADYVYAVGDIPIALVAHLDTVFAHPAMEVYYDREKGIMWSPDGLGADDRAGVFSIIKIIQSGLRPSIIFTTKEEVGGLGALALSKIPCPFEGLKYMIELDRRGTNDCVFYDCYNPDFINYIEQFDFYEQWGTFSDICYLMPGWQICGVNLSVGYNNEHTRSETLYVPALLNTIEKVKRMLNEKDIPDFEYRELDYTSVHIKKYLGDTYAQCECCNVYHFDSNIFPVRVGLTEVQLLCLDCVDKKANWCEECGEPYLKQLGSSEKYCDCCLIGNEENLGGWRVDV